MTKVSYVSFREVIEINEKDFKVFQNHAKTMIYAIDANSSLCDAAKDAIKADLQSYTTNQTKFEQNAINCNDFEITYLNGNPNGHLVNFTLADWDNLSLQEICEEGPLVKANFVCEAITTIYNSLDISGICETAEL